MIDEIKLKIENVLGGTTRRKLRAYLSSGRRLLDLFTMSEITNGIRKLVSIYPCPNCRSSTYVKARVIETNPEGDTNYNIQCTNCGYCPEETKFRVPEETGVSFERIYVDVHTWNEHCRNESESGKNKIEGKITPYFSLEKDKHDEAPSPINEGGSTLEMGSRIRSSGRTGSINFGRRYSSRDLMSMWSSIGTTVTDSTSF